MDRNRWEQIDKLFNDVLEREPQPVTELVLVQNWFEELKRLAPTGKK